MCPQRIGGGSPRPGSTASSGRSFGGGFDRPGFVRQSGPVALWVVLYYALMLFWLLLIGRIIIEFVRGFARDWHPRGVVVVVLEAIFTVTDPPVKLLRRLIPPISLGGFRLDLSIMVLVFIVFVLMSIVQRQAQLAVTM